MARPIYNHTLYYVLFTRVQEREEREGEEAEATCGDGERLYADFVVWGEGRLKRKGEDERK